jgi:ABC-type sugar transport system ATPase subunit
LFGLEVAPADMEITYKGKKVEKISPQSLIDLKWAFIPAERRAQGLMLNWSMLKNVSIVILQRLLSRFKLIKHRDEQKIAMKYINDLSIATDSVEKTVDFLSGGNQQKVVLAKWLATEPEFLILNDPTRGIDVGTKREIYRLINGWASKEYTILFTSSEIEEVIGLSQRILVFYKGEIIHEFKAAETDKEEIMLYVLGGKAAMNGAGGDVVFAA